MSSTPNRATNPAGKPRKKEVTLDLSTARQMLPLVKSIVTDIVNSRLAIARWQPRRPAAARVIREPIAGPTCEPVRTSGAVR